MANKKSTPLPEYESPPVIEVVCGLTFAPLPRFQAVHIGLLWDRMRKELPRVEEHPPLAIPVERLDPVEPATAEIELSDRPPLPRVWFLDSLGNQIVQIQQNAFLHNWRRISPDDRYPRYVSILANFRRQLELFQRFIKEASIGEVVPVQCELTYVNRIFENELWSKGKSLEQVFPDFGWRDSPKRFLPVYEGAHWRTAYRLPDDHGRLHAVLQIGLMRPDRQPVVSLEMRARGIGGDKSIDGIWSWFNVAHEWIVRGFTDITSERAQKQLWGRTK